MKDKKKQEQKVTEVADFFDAPKAKKAKKLAKPSKPAKSKLILIGVKMTRETHALLVKRAKAEADGNLSAWLRHSGLRYTPKRGEKVRLQAA